jgi:hypothetical protein
MPGQGKTLDESYVCHSAQWRSSAAYVALTRHRESVHIFAAHLKAFDRRRRRGQRLKSARRIDKAFQRAMIRLQPVVEIFDLPVLNTLVQLASAFEGADRSSVSVILVGVDCLGRAVLTQLQSLPEKSTSPR